MNREIHGQEMSRRLRPKEVLAGGGEGGGVEGEWRDKSKAE